MTATTTTTRLDLDFVVMTADFVVWSKILVEVTVNRVCTTALRALLSLHSRRNTLWCRYHYSDVCKIRNTTFGKYLV